MTDVLHYPLSREAEHRLARRAIDQALATIKNAGAGTESELTEAWKALLEYREHTTHSERCKVLRILPRNSRQWTYAQLALVRFHERTHSDDEIMSELSAALEEQLVLDELNAILDPDTTFDFSSVQTEPKAGE